MTNNENKNLQTQIWSVSKIVWKKPVSTVSLSYFFCFRHWDFWTIEKTLTIYCLNLNFTDLAHNIRTTSEKKSEAVLLSKLARKVSLELNVSKCYNFLKLNELTQDIFEILPLLDEKLSQRAKSQFH